MKLQLVIYFIFSLTCLQAQEDAQSSAETEPVKPPKAEVVSEDQPEGEPISGSENETEPILVKPIIDPASAVVHQDESKVEDDLRGLQIKIEKYTNNSSKESDTSEVKVSAPWHPKPLNTPPLGWKFILASKSVKPYKTTASLGDGKLITLSITPHMLVPVSDGKTVIRIAEPGYKPNQDYFKNNTVGSMLHDSTQEIEKYEKQAAEAISRLQQLLSSLPKN